MQNRGTLSKETRDALRTRVMPYRRWIPLYDHWNTEAQENRFPKVPPGQTELCIKETKEPIWMETDHEG